MAFAAAFRATTAAALGIDASTIVINGISTDGDDTPGCAGGGGAGVTSGSTITVSPEFAASLHPTAFDDCYLTPEEMATSPAAMAFAQSFRESAAASLGVTADDIILDGISTDGDDTPGCSGGPAQNGGLSVQVRICSTDVVRSCSRCMKMWMGCCAYLPWRAGF